MTVNVGKKLAALQRLTIQELRARLCRRVRRVDQLRQPCLAGETDHLAVAGAWPKATSPSVLRRRASELANDADLRMSPPKAKAAPAEATDRAMTVMLGDKADDRLPLPGTIFTREYKGGVVQVKILANGFEFEGEVYKSLSAVAKAITGSHVNGFTFFKLAKETVQ